MQRIGLLFVGLLLLAPARAPGQQAMGTTLWRVAATTLPVPPALTLGPAAVMWNPAQTQDSARLQLALEAIQTPAAVDATGLIAAVRIPAGSIGQLGLLYGRVGLSDIAQTVDSPDPTGSVVPVYTFAIGATWSRLVGATSVGATLAFHETRLDLVRADRWTIDVGGRYGVSFAHGFGADHQFGVGAEVAKTVALDLMLAREGGYSDGAHWRPVAGLRLVIGKYRVTLARDTGVNNLGSTYRVGVEMRFR